MAQFSEEIVLTLKDQFTQNANKISGSIDGIKKAAELAAGAYGLKKLSDVMISSLKEYAEAEKAQTQLAFALKQVGITSQSVVQDYKEFADQQEKVTMYTAEQVMGIERLFTQYGLYGAELKRATKATLDFAAAKGIDADSAANIFSKAAAGNVDALKRYGIQVNLAKVETQGLGAVLEATEKKFAGFSEAASNTAAGRMDQFQKSIKNLSEAFGGLIATFDEKNGISKTWTGWIEALTTKLEGAEDPAKGLRVELEKLERVKASLEADRNNRQDENASWLNKLLSGHWTEKDESNLKSVTSNIERLHKEISETEKAQTSLVEQGSKKPIGATGFKLDPAIQKQIDDAKKAYKEYYADLVFRSAEGYAKIEAERQKDLTSERNKWTEVQKYLLKGTKEYQSYYSMHIAAINEIEKKAQKEKMIATGENLTQGLNAAKQFVTEVTQNSAQAFTNLTSNIGNLVGKVSGNQAFGLVGQVFSAAVGVAQGIQSIFSAFDEDTRSAFKRMSDYIAEIDKQIQETEDRVDSLLKHRDKASDRTEGDFKNTNPNMDENESEDMFIGELAMRLSGGTRKIGNYNERSIAIQIADGDYHWQIDDKGNFAVIWRQTVIGLKRFPSGEWFILTNITAMDENGTKIVCQFIYEFAVRKNAVNTAALGVDTKATKTPTPTSSTIGNYNGSNTNVPNSNSSTAPQTDWASFFRNGTSSASGSGGSAQLNININTIDSQGVQDFAMYQLAPIMRELSGRQSVVFLNENGVSSNI